MGSQRIKVAFVKFAGLAESGTENYLQNIACLLQDAGFDVHYFYSNAAPYIGSKFKHVPNNISNLSKLQNAGVTVTKFFIQSKDIRRYDHYWVNSNFFNVFNESDFDLVICGKGGSSEYPFNFIRKIPIIETIHLGKGVDNQENIYKSVHLSLYSLNRWIEEGGDPFKGVCISNPLYIPNSTDIERLWPIDFTIYGFHQRNDDEIFTPIALDAYYKIQNDKTAFLVINGSNLYSEHARKLNLNNFIQINHSVDRTRLFNLLRGIDVFTHCRKDGEVAPSSIAEAISLSKPVISHYSPDNNGQADFISKFGVVCKSVEDYSQYMQYFSDQDVRRKFTNGAHDYFMKRFDKSAIKDQFTSLCNEAVCNFSYKQGFLENVYSSIIHYVKIFTSRAFYAWNRIFK